MVSFCSFIFAERLLFPANNLTDSRRLFIYRVQTSKGNNKWRRDNGIQFISVAVVTVPKNSFFSLSQVQSVFLPPFPPIISQVPWIKNILCSIFFHSASHIVGKYLQKLKEPRMLQHASHQVTHAHKSNCLCKTLFWRNHLEREIPKVETFSQYIPFCTYLVLSVTQEFGFTL